MEQLNRLKSKSEPTLTVLIFVTIAIGIVSGLAGMFLALLLHHIQHVAYGYSHTLAHPENFLQGVSASSIQRRIFVLTFCGFLAGFGWWAIYRYGKPLISIANAIKSDKPHMPIGTTILNALLQIITVALGSPLGREVAPREVGSAFACWLCAKTGLSTKDSQIMVACGSGAGLAAVYNVPLGGVVFILEILLCTLSWSAVIPALCTCSIATAVSWIGLGNAPQYHIPNYPLSASLILWSILVGPIFGVAAFRFHQITTAARQSAPRNWRVLILCILNFIVIGLLSVYFPQLLGNGKGPIQLGFTDDLGVDLAIRLLILRVLIVWSSLQVGAQGGLLTPSLANGVLLAIALGGVWSIAWPGTHAGAFAVVGAAAFLGAAQKMPITAIVLTAEFTGINFNFLVPILFAVTGSVSTFRFYANRQANINPNQRISIP
ncbi:chloride channel protein [Legionella maceachernii]|uniref:Chloride channel protein n=1 Tax=Legionella maceachernii TaxID=466 RepID=A0A0W0WI39_9GAMM|nr:chloride channel protein [Legionella maceachernii]KTD31973.1 chloride channel protein [Legionella maceachernii]SKA24168.1 H+/Cl-antiporter ClcA [Legionella maceachernii]SUP04253.1 H(+)/Cl(-) exchange transporter ClcA [Legionella maceachernii]